MDSKEIVTEFLEVWDNTVRCLDRANSANLIRYLPTARYLIDTANEVLALHKSTVIASLLKAIPEGLRPMFMSSLSNVRISISPVTYVGECREQIELLLAYSSRISERVSISTRSRVGIAKITALISRLMVSDRLISLDYQTLLALLTELRFLVLTGVAV
jgi:hypothetical protein